MAPIADIEVACVRRVSGAENSDCANRVTYDRLSFTLRKP
jgi:hypothetical protein